MRLQKGLKGMVNWWKRRKLRTKLFFILFPVFFIWFFFCLPAQLFDQPTSFVIEDSNGNLLGANVSEDGQWRFPEMKSVPQKFEKCILAYEDKRFYKHIGIDFLAMGRAVRQNIQKKRVVSGGSTITMQVIRLSRKKNRNLWQKLLEGIYAIRLELRCSKKEILGLYASHAPFGSNVVGLDAAAWRYYGRSPDQLSWGEMAALSVLPNSPSLVHPGKNQRELFRKRNQVLEKLRDSHVIDQTTYLLALDEPLPGAPVSLPQLAPHLLQRYQLEYKKNKWNSPTRLRTTIDGELQQQVLEIVEQHHLPLRQNGINNICAMVLDVETGKVLSYVGNIYHPGNPDLESHVDIISAPRSPGSLLKPLLYASELTDGNILPYSLLPDVPTQIGGYMPENFDHTYDGAVTAAASVSRSLNIPCVRMLRQYKYPRFYDVLQQGGITTLNNPPDHYGLSMILGGCEVNMWDVAGMYASIARAYLHQDRWKGKIVKGDFHPPLYYDGAQVSENDSSAYNIPLDMSSIWYMFKAMQDVMRPGEEGLWQQFVSSKKVAWKTGTSFGFRDGWAIGITPGHVVAVWTGNADGEGRAGLIGVRTAAPVMFDIFRVLPSSGWFSAPEYGIEFIQVCSESGYKAGEHCARTESLLISSHGQKSQVCPFHQLINMDPTGNFRVNESCMNPMDMNHTGWFVLPPSMEAYYRQNHSDYKPLPPLMPGCEELDGKGMMELYYPQDNAKVYVPVELSGKQGSMVCTATHKNKESKIHWHLDDQFMGTTQYIHQLALSPAPGRHKLTLVDGNGETITRRFIVLEK